jgi:16S rRNA G1207 methylase RsmC
MAVDAGNVAVADCYDWTTVRHVADIGGGTGTLIAEVLRRNPRLPALREGARAER